MSETEEPRQTKRTTFRRLNQMNGDFLLLLKKPICSEIGRDVKGHNEAHVVDMKKELNLLYKQRDIELAKVRRSQEAVYNTMLRMHKMKKIRQKDAYKHMQDEARKVHQRERKLRFSLASQNTDDSEELQVKGALVDDVSVQHSLVSSDDGPDVLSLSNKENDLPPLKLPDIRDGKTSGSRKAEGLKKSRVLEVRKGAPRDPLVRERSTSDLDIKVIIHRKEGQPEEPPGATEPPDLGEEMADRVHDSNETLTRFSKIHPGLLGQAGQKHNDSVEKQAPKRKLGVSGTREDQSILEGLAPTFPVHHLTEKKKVSIMVQPKMPPIEEFPTSHHNLPHNLDKPSSQPIPAAEHGLVAPNSFSAGFRGTKRTLGSAGSSTCVLDNRARLSQVEINKLQALEREQRMRDILNREALNIYVKDSKGDIVPSILPFTRKTFQPPSLKEKHFQHKKLREEEEAKLTHGQKMEVFFSKVEADGIRRQNLREHRISEAPVPDEKKRPLGNEGQITLSHVVTAFQRPAEIPEDVDPASFEALKYCKYLRSYTPPNCKRKRKSKARREKITNPSMK